MSTTMKKIRSHEIKDVKSDLKRLRGHLGKLVSRVSEASQDEAGELRNMAQSELHVLRSRAEGTYKKIRKDSGVARDQVEESVEKHPLASLLVAFGTGALIGAIAGRS